MNKGVFISYYVVALIHSPYSLYYGVCFSFRVCARWREIKAVYRVWGKYVRFEGGVVCVSGFVQNDVQGAKMKENLRIWDFCSTFASQIAVTI